MSPDVDRETTRAVSDLVRRLKDQGDADDEFVAREFLLWLKAQGWRPVIERPSLGWGPRQAGDHTPDEAKPGGAGYREALEEVRAKAQRDARKLGHGTEGAA